MKKHRHTTTGIIMLGFFLGAVTGTIGLLLPISLKPGCELDFFDALFVAMSSVCVTGLSTVNIGQTFSVFGQVILLFLIQFGGLGIVTFTTLILCLFRQRITLADRMVIQNAYNLDTLSGLVRLTMRILKVTLTLEGIGAVGYAFVFIPEYGIKGIWYSVFHAVSAFCNAGIDILGEKSLAGYAVNPVVNLTTILLIVLSGIGFTVWFDVLASVREAFRRENPVRWRFGRLKLHSKLAIITTVILIAAGAAFIFIAEYGNQDTIGGMNTGQKLMASLFQSVTTRTAGFYTFSQGALHEESKLFCSVLMFIGGSPGGTAGGVKTTTFAMLILACVTFARGGNDTECMGRKISVANFRTGFCVVMVAFAVFITGTIAVLALEPDSVATIDVLYETASAVGTVGLTADLTPRLCRASQIVLMIMMYMGRLGPLTLVLTFAGKTHPRDKVRSLPKEQIMVG